MYESMGRKYGDQNKIKEYFKEYFMSHKPKTYSLLFIDPPFIDDYKYK